MTAAHRHGSGRASRRRASGGGPDRPTRAEGADGGDVHAPVRRERRGHEGRARARSMRGWSMVALRQVCGASSLRSRAVTRSFCESAGEGALDRAAERCPARPRRRPRSGRSSAAARPPDAPARSAWTAAGELVAVVGGCRSVGDPSGSSSSRSTPTSTHPSASEPVDVEVDQHPAGVGQRVVAPDPPPRSRRCAPSAVWARSSASWWSPLSRYAAQRSRGHAVPRTSRSRCRCRCPVPIVTPRVCLPSGSLTQQHRSALRGCHEKVRRIGNTGRPLLR